MRLDILKSITTVAFLMRANMCVLQYTRKRESEIERVRVCVLGECVRVTMCMCVCVCVCVCVLTNT